MAACRAAYFSKVIKLSELEDLTYFRDLILILIQVLILSLIRGRTPMRMNPFLTSPPQVMILVTPMIIPMKLFGPRLPEVCGEWPMSLMGSCTLQETTCKAISFPTI